MFGLGNKKKARLKFEEEVRNYNENVVDLNKKIERLHHEKEKTYLILKDVETYLNMLKNKPEHLVKEFNSAKLEISTYEKEIAKIKRELDKLDKNSLVESMKMAAVITTFKGLSTKSVISGMTSLTGATASFGGGMLTAGATSSLVAGATSSLAAGATASLAAGTTASFAAGGIAGTGTTFLGLSNPIGWAILGAITGITINSKNKKSIEKYNIETVNVKKMVVETKLLIEKIDKVSKGLVKDADMLKFRLELAQKNNPKRYDAMSDDQRLDLGTLVNLLSIAAKKINEKVSLDENN